MRRLVDVLAWTAVIASILVLLVFGAGRVSEMIAGAADPFGRRYVEHPVVALVHFLPGLAYLVLGPFQFVRRIRCRHPAWHRGMGRVLVVLAGVSGVYALVAAAVLPAYGGALTQAATGVFGVWFLASLVMAIRHVRARRIALHREWMIRAFAVALGVATIRAWVGLLQAFGGWTMLDVFGIAFWLGLVTNAVAAEVWIRGTRPERPSRGRGGRDSLPEGGPAGGRPPTRETS